MLFSARSLRTRVLALSSSFSLLCAAPLFCAAQTAKPQFSQPQVQPTSAQVTGLAVGDTQVRGVQDILYLGKPSADNSVTAGLLLNNGAGAFSDLVQNQHTFQNVTAVVATVADVDGDNIPDFIFATSPSAAGGTQLCILYGTGQASSTGAYSTTRSGCTSFSLPGGKLPVFTSVTVARSSPGVPPQLYLADSANAQLYVIGNQGTAGDGTTLSGFSLLATYPLSTGDGTGTPQAAAGLFKTGGAQSLILEQSALLIPYLNSGDPANFTAMPPLPGTPSPSVLAPSALQIADLDGDGNGDVVALYANPAASSDPTTAPTAAPNQLYIWFGNGDGTFAQPQIVSLSRRFSMAAIADMNNDGHPDIVLADDSVLSVLSNQGGRTFHSDFGTSCSPCAEQQFPAAQRINAIAAADVNGDARPDVVLANGTANPAAPNALPAGESSPAAPRANANTGSSGVTVLPNVGSIGVTGSAVAFPEPSSINSSFQITITVTPPPGSTIPPSGTVDLTVGTSLIGTFTLQPFANSSTNSSGVIAGIGNNNVPAGTYPISAVYSGDANYAGTTITGTHVISANTTSTTLLLCVGPNPGCPASGPFSPPPYSPTASMIFGQYVNVVAPVQTQDGITPTGTITFALDGRVLCSYTVIVQQCPASAIQNLEASLTGGQHTLVATYSNDPNHGGSSSQVVITVAPDSTTTTLTGTPNPAAQGTPVSFTITVTGQFAAPTGTFTFSNGSASLGTATLNPTGPITSTATFTTSTLPVGTDQVSANYAGNQNFLPSSSGSFAEVITPLTPAGFTLTVGPPTINIGVGTAGALAVTVTSVNGFSGAVTLSCAGLPSEAGCTFQNPVINGGGATTLFISTTAPHSCNSTQPYFVGSNGGGLGLRSLALPAMAGIFAFFLPGRRRWLRGLLMIAVATCAIHLSGCGNCTDLATRPGTYHITVDATAGGGASASKQSQTITVHVVI